MRQLRSCDFCGADADGVYEVLPRELSPTEAEQRRVVLCGDCSETLATVLEPLLDRLGVEGAESADESAEPGRDAPTDPLGENSPMVAGRDAADELSAEASESKSDPEPASADDARTDTETSGIADATDEAAGEPLQAASGDDAGEREASGDAGGESDESTEGADAGAGEEPPQFRKVMRLLNNREFPVERAEVEELAAGAYDLDDDHVRDIVDYAVERGVLVDDGGTLRKA